MRATSKGGAVQLPWAGGRKIDVPTTEGQAVRSRPLRGQSRMAQGRSAHSMPRYCSTQGVQSKSPKPRKRELSTFAEEQRFFEPKHTDKTLPSQKDICWTPLVSLRLYLAHCWLFRQMVVVKRDIVPEEVGEIGERYSRKEKKNELDIQFVLICVRFVPSSSHPALLYPVCEVFFVSLTYHEGP